MSIPNTFVNSNYTEKHIVDADKLNENFQYILNQIGGSPIKNLIISSGQSFNELNVNQIITAIVQYILAGQYFIDESTLANSIVLAPSVSSYSVPATYVDKMEFLFTPAFSNTSAVTMIFKGLDSLSYTKPLLSKTGNPLTSGSIIAGTSYAVHYDSNIITGGAFVLGSLRTNGSNGSADASSAVEFLINSLNIEYNQDIISQLTQAVAQYALLTSYNDISSTGDRSSNTYRISPFYRENSSIISLVTPFEYYNGMTITFKPSFSNTQKAYAIIDGFSSPVEIKNILGNDTIAGDLCQGIDVTIKYLNGYFYLISNKQSKLSLTHGVEVNGIEGTLSSSSNKLPTSEAVTNSISENISPLQEGITNITERVDELTTELQTSNSVASRNYSVVKGPASNNNQTYINYSSVSESFTLLANTVVRYANGEYETIDEDTELDISPSVIPTNFKVLYVKNSGLMVIDSSKYTESNVIPPVSASADDVYVYTDLYGRITTYIFDGTSWNETLFVKVGFGTVSSEVVGDDTIYTVNLSVPPLCGRYISTNISLPDFSTDSLIISHNIDSLCNVKVKLICQDTDLAYTAGESIELSPFITGTEYFFIGNTNISTVINSSGILLPDSNGIPSAITASKWKFFIDIERAF